MLGYGRRHLKSLIFPTPTPGFFKHRITRQKPLINLPLLKIESVIIREVRQRLFLML